MQRLCGMIGMARRAGEVVMGTELVCTAMPKGKVKLVLISSTASDQTKKKLSVKSEFYRIPYVVADIDTESLGRILGKSCAVAGIAITGAGLAEEIRKAAVSN